MIVALLIIIVLCLIFGGKNIGLAILFIPLIALVVKYPIPALIIGGASLTTYDYYNRNIKGKKQKSNS